MHAIYVIMIEHVMINLRGVGQMCQNYCSSGVKEKRVYHKTILSQVTIKAVH